MKQFFRVEYADKNNPKDQRLNSFFDTWGDAEMFSRWLKNDEKIENIIISWWEFSKKQKWYILKYLKEIK